MSYRLVIDWPDGTQSQSRPSPSEDRYELGGQVMQFITDQVPDITIGDSVRLVRAVSAAPLGEPVLHEPSGFRFTVKEF